MGNAPTIAGYGAPRKAHSVLNWWGIGPEFIQLTVDRRPHNQRWLLPGARLPIRSADAIIKAKLDDAMILLWNRPNEIVTRMVGLRDRGGRCLVPPSKLRIR
jgi:hypothetical protein